MAASRDRAARPALLLFGLAVCTAALAGCAARRAAPPSPTLAPGTRTMVVRATAYNSTPAQTSGDPSIAAWGDRLIPGMRAIAVSRDLLDAGLRPGTRVRIEGLDGEYVVLDKMGPGSRRHIDIYMGKNVRSARHWGSKKVRISWVESEAAPAASAPAAAPGSGGR